MPIIPLDNILTKNLVLIDPVTGTVFGKDAVAVLVPIGEMDKVLASDATARELALTEGCPLLLEW